MVVDMNSFILQVTKITVDKRINEIVNRLNKTKEETHPDFREEREARDRRKREDLRAKQREQEKREKEERERKAKEAELRFVDEDYLIIVCTSR